MEILNLTKTHNITLIEGDGIGPEISYWVVEIIKAAKVKINWEKKLAGATAFEKTGELIPKETLESI